MLKPALFFILLITYYHANAQVPDFIAVKKKNGVTVQNFYAGTRIDFYTSYNHVEGPIEAIANDSIYIKFYRVSVYPTIWGTRVYDTLGTSVVPFHYKEIKAVNFTNRSYSGPNLLSSILKLGGAAYFGLNVINSLIRNESLANTSNLINMGAGAAAFGLGTLLKARGAGRFNPRKHSIVYVNMQ